MPRYARNTAILFKLETTYGVDAAPTGSANALLVSNLTLTPLSAQNVDRANVRPYFGNNEELVGTKSVEMAFDVELAGSGALGTAPLWGPLVRACAFAEIITAGVSVEYSPITNAQSSGTVYWYDDGVLHSMVGARGTFSIKAGISQRPVFSFKFTGLYVPITAATAPSVVLGAWQKPKVITDQNTGDITFGGTYAAGAITGGTAFPSRGIDLDIGNQVAYVPLLGGDSVDITDRKSTCKIELDLTSAQVVTRYGDVINNTTQSVSLAHGTVAGNTVQLWMPGVQFVNPGKTETSGRRLESFDGRIVPVNGNDDLIICAR